LGHGGEGIGHSVDEDAPRETWFVADTLPGERVLVERVKVQGGRVVARLHQIIEPAAERVTPPCAIAEDCGGCSWQHIEPSAQSRLKAEIVRGQLRRVIDTIDAVHPSPQWRGYRRRARLHVRRKGSEFKLGFHRSGGREIVDVESCVVLDEPCQVALTALRQHAYLLPGLGEVWLVSNGREAMIGIAAASRENVERDAFRILLGDVVVGVHLRSPGRTSVIGRSEISARDAQGVHEISLRPFGFAQAQSAQNAALVAAVTRLAQAKDADVLELFCGAGNFTRSLATHARNIIACDEDHEALVNLRKSAASGNWPCEAVHRSALVALQEAAQAKRKFDVVVLDPPRTGLGTAGAQILTEVAKQRIVYVSCDPATLARDLSILVGNGFAIQTTEVFDLMPMTSEVEVVVALDRVTQGS
jgi:23S rRNA (uracil1939-C5)-methyltransferase